MATAYAAVVSLIHVMDQIKLYHASQPIFLDEQQVQLESLNKLLCFFQDFLEYYSHGGSKDMDGLESRIANASHAAEDIIESHIVDYIHDRSKGHANWSSNHFSQALQKVIKGMDLIKNELMEIKEASTFKNQLPQDSAPVQSSGPPSKKDTVMVYDDDLNHIVDKLIDQHCSRQVIPITGMGGIGKTTLAKISYENMSVVSHFDIRGWVTISQQYDVQEILLRLLNDMHVDLGKSDEESREERHLGLKLHQHLFQRRYLIVLDDMWSIEAWDRLKSFLPDTNSGSRIAVTSRMLTVANHFTSSDLYQMNLLDESDSWNLLRRKVFVEEICPPELVDIGKTIAKNCKGLPLSIGAIGGLLAKSNMVREYWEYVAENTNTTLSSNDEENCLNILSLSYSHLPIHLKPCFLYMGVFSEDYEIRVSKLIKLWVAEGILKPDKAKSLEQVGRDYVKDLIERNLLSVTKLGCTGNVKYCKIHDLLRDMCLGEAQKEKFLHIKTVYMPNNSQETNRHFKVVRFANNADLIKLNNTDTLKGPNSKRRIAIHLKSNERYTPQELLVPPSTSFLRSLICDFNLEFVGLVDFRLLRVFDVHRYNCSKVIFQLVNSRYLNFQLKSRVLPSSIYMFWNLQTMIIDPQFETRFTASVEIWKMPQLRHLIISYSLSLRAPPVNQMDGIVLENLQTLSCVLNFRCTEEVVRKIPNVVKLKLEYDGRHEKGLPPYSLNNVRNLKKLQSLYCKFPYIYSNYLRQILGFPVSLRKLTLYEVGLDWEEITTKIGSLPHLEKLILNFFSSGDKWNPVEGHFLNLKFLKIDYNTELVCWTADSVHFPVLEHLVLRSLRSLKEIPSGIGDIPTFRLIEVVYCKDSVIDSAKEILKEQKSFGNDGLSLVVDEKHVIIESEDEDESSE